MTRPTPLGFELLEWVRGKPEYASVPIVVLSSSDQPLDIDKALRLGAHLFLTKPITKEQLQEVLGKFCV
jgi:CheY-like chemotaxis protein